MAAPSAWMKENSHDRRSRSASPVARQAARTGKALRRSDCPLAGEHIVQGIERAGATPRRRPSTPHPIEIFARAYGLTDGVCDARQPSARSPPPTSCPPPTTREAAQGAARRRASPIEAPAPHRGRARRHASISRTTTPCCCRCRRCCYIEKGGDGADRRTSWPPTIR